MANDATLCDRCEEREGTHTVTVHTVGGEPDEIWWEDAWLCDECDTPRH